MNRLQRAALLGRLIQELREQGSWCGETHVQKATFLLQEMMDTPMGFDFILYKHGPFSFDLRDEITALRADELLRLQPQWPYGPRIVPTERSRAFQKLCSRTLAKYNDRIVFVAEKLGGRGVEELERLATAFYVTERTGVDSSTDKRAEELTRLKPHITLESAKGATEEIDEVLDESRKYIH